MSTTKDLVLAHLRRDKIKLWLPPFLDPSALRGGGCDLGRINDEALAKLAESLREKISSVPATDRRDPVEDDSHGGADGARCRRRPGSDEILTCLLELQDHAVRKLREKKEKNSADVKILASERHLASLPDDATALAALSAASWGGDASVKDRGRKHLLVRVVDVSPTLTADALSADVRRALNAGTARVIWRGRQLASASREPLRSILSDGGGGVALSQKRKGELLCLVSGLGLAPPAAASLPAAAGDADAIAQQTDSSVVESIRRAARTIQGSAKGSRFEVTDQRGNLVPMTRGDSTAFLAALGLHRIGRSRLEGQGREIHGREDAARSALAFLLEADAEWNGSPALDRWRSMADNYGLLQLDIAWCFLLLESLESLEDAARRLDVAEAVLTKQVHANFVTLALVQAEAGNPIPPLCSVFARLYLLQGVADRTRGRDTAARERLGRAQTLCHRLRASSPADSVDALCDACLVDRPTAVAALRRSDGDPDAAGSLIAGGRDEERVAATRRRRQRRMGRCANGADFVDPDLVPVLCGMLGYDGAPGGAGGDGDPSTGESIAIALLRLSDNVVERALELYGGVGAGGALERAARLDVARGDGAREGRGHEVRDMDLAVLASMGVDEERGRSALREAGSVDGALLWLSRDEKDCGSGGGVRNEGPAGAGAAGHGVAAGRNEAGDSAVPGRSRGIGGKYGSSFESEEGSDVDDAYQLLEKELGNALGNDSRQLLEKEWLGVDLQDEWELIQKYI